MINLKSLGVAKAVQLVRVVRLVKVVRVEGVVKVIEVIKAVRFVRGMSRGQGQGGRLGGPRGRGSREKPTWSQGVNRET